MRSAKAIGESHELANFHASVARRARTWRFARKISFNEWVDDRALEELAAIKSKMRNAHGVCHAARIVLVFGSAAAAMGFRIVFACFTWVVPKMKRNPNDIVALIHEACGRHCGVNPAAHRNENTTKNTIWGGSWHGPREKAEKPRERLRELGAESPRERAIAPGSRF
jgi:hypothetical protein